MDMVAPISWAGRGGASGDADAGQRAWRRAASTTCGYGRSGVDAEFISSLARWQGAASSVRCFSPSQRVAVEKTLEAFLALDLLRAPKSSSATGRRARRCNGNSPMRLLSRRPAGRSAGGHLRRCRCVRVSPKPHGHVRIGAVGSARQRPAGCGVSGAGAARGDRRGASRAASMRIWPAPVSALWNARAQACRDFRAAHDLGGQRTQLSHSYKRGAGIQAPQGRRPDFFRPGGARALPRMGAIDNTDLCRPLLPISTPPPSGSTARRYGRR